MNLFESALTPQKARKMPKKSNNEKKKDAEAAGRPPKKTKQANKILIHSGYGILLPKLF